MQIAITATMLAASLAEVATATVQKTCDFYAPGLCRIKARQHSRSTNPLREKQICVAASTDDHDGDDDHIKIVCNNSLSEVDCTPENDVIVSNASCAANSRRSVCKVLSALQTGAFKRRIHTHGGLWACHTWRSPEWENTPLILENETKHNVTKGKYRCMQPYETCISHEGDGTP